MREAMIIYHLKYFTNSFWPYLYLDNYDIRTKILNFQTNPIIVFRALCYVLVIMW